MSIESEYLPPSSISVIVCAYTDQRWTDLERAIDSLADQHRPVSEVILVCDNNEALLERSRDAFPGVHVVPNTHTPGLSGARNTGITLAKGDVVAFLDDDASAEPEWSGLMLDAYSDPDVIGVGGALVPRWQAPRPRWLPEEFLWVVGCNYRGLPSERAEVRNAIGANMSFRRTVFEQVGDFDPSVGRIGKNAGGCEETEFSIRARRLIPNSRIMLEPAAVCHHTVTAERVTRAYFRRRCQAEGRSKAVVSQLSGATAGLSAERTYVSRVLPRGVLAGVRDLVHGDRTGGARALAIVEGLALTATSYVATRAPRPTPRS